MRGDANTLELTISGGTQAERDEALAFATRFGLGWTGEPIAIQLRGAPAMPDGPAGAAARTEPSSRRKRP
jgi:hypothetical protein